MRWANPTPAQIRAGINRGDPHLAHVAVHGVAAALPPLTPQGDGDPPRPKERIAGVDFIDPVFDRDLHRRRPRGLIVEAGPTDLEQFGLRDQGEPRVLAVDQR